MVSTHRRPIRAVIYGLIWGVGLFIWLTIAQPAIGFDSVDTVAVKAAVVIGGAVLISLLWAYLGPAKKPKGSPPTPADTAADRSRA